jgi:hypothetical protein
MDEDGLDLARHFDRMKLYISGMEECFENFRKLTGKEPDECSQQDGEPSTGMSGTGSMSQPVLV